MGEGSGKEIWRQTEMVLINHQAPVERRIGAAVALQPVAETAIHADLQRRILVRRQFAVGIVLILTVLFARRGLFGIFEDFAGKKNREPV